MTPSARGSMQRQRRKILLFALSLHVRIMFMDMVFRVGLVVESRYRVGTKLDPAEAGDRKRRPRARDGDGDDDGRQLLRIEDED